MARMQFGLGIPPGSAGWFKNLSRETFVADTRRALDRISGVIDSFWTPDHLDLGVATDSLEAWTTLSYLAGLYPELRFSPLVASQSYRNPALFAKMAATLHYLSGGRLIMGLGAGWLEQEYKSYGYPFPPATARVEQLDEAIQVMKALWSSDAATFKGDHYAVEDAHCEPRHGTPPILMIGGTRPRLMRVVARRADWWNSPWEGRDDFLASTARLNRACADVGRDPATVRRTWAGLCSCATTEEAARQALLGGAFEGHANGLVGTPDQIVAGLRPLR